jgi:hypothetical protein
MAKTPAPVCSAVRRRKGISSTRVSVWQDDPISGLQVIDRPVPNLAEGALRFKIKGNAVTPGKYPAGTAQFRYWTAAEALRRGGDFWAPLLGIDRWEPGRVLGVNLDKGVDLNAYYDRSELAFFHEEVGQVTYYSGESPDVVCHEMGHACLDAHRPELFDAPFVEAAAFHESFGDMSAILTALQLPGVRAAALQALRANRSSQLSRCAEQLGAALRQVAKDAVEKDCLRNAYNKFKYVDPQTLPDDAPAARLCAEPHSFSRVFTGAFYEILSGMLGLRAKSPTQADLAVVARDLALLLVDATAAAPIQPDYFAQVAAHMIDADSVRFAGKYRSVLTATFLERLIIPATAVHALVSHKGKVPASVVAASVAAPRPRTQLHPVTLNARDFGLATRKQITVLAPLEHKPFLSVAAGLAAHAQCGPAEVEQATHHFVKTLFARDRVDVNSGAIKAAVNADTPRAQLRKTHVLTETREGFTLTRRLFHCGCTVTAQG